MTLLTMVQEAAVLCNLPQPSSVISSTDPNVPILLALANQEGQELSRRHDWSGLMLQNFTFASVAAEQQTAFPADFERLLPNPELWNRTSSQKYTGPVSMREWYQLKTLAVTASSPGYWMLFYTGGIPPPSVMITPAPTAGETLAIPYVIKGWAADSSNVTYSDQWNADTDFGTIPERLMKLGIIWRYRKTKGLDYAEDMATYEREVERACSRDRGDNVLRLRRGRLDDYISWPTWPGQVIP